MSSRSKRGRQAETLALRWLRRRGLVLVTRNYRCRWGELDLIMRDADILVVVEVRSRSHGRFLSPAMSVDWRKQAKIVRSTEFFLRQHRRFAGLAVRFDVVSIAGDSSPEIKWITNAFEPED